MSVVQIQDSLQEIVIKMSEGNPGGLTVLMEILGEKGAKIDPYADPFALVLMLDTLNLRGHKLWDLHKHVSEFDMRRTLAAIRAVQLGLFEEKKLHEAVDKREALNLIEDVQKELPNFAQGED